MATVTRPLGGGAGPYYHTDDLRPHSARLRSRTPRSPSRSSGPLEVDRTAVTLFAPGEPPLLLTHVPLLQVPPGCVNVHGHVHQKESPSRNRHISVSVEQLDYRPVKLNDIRRLARRLLEGRTVPGHSTRARLNVVERVMP